MKIVFTRKKALKFKNNERSPSLQHEINTIQLKIENEKLKQQIYKLETENPFRCPITHEPIQDLVICMADGHFYEKLEIEMWFKQCKKSPITNQAISSSDLCNAASLPKYIITLHDILKRNRESYNRIMIELKQKSSPKPTHIKQSKLYN